MQHSRLDPIIQAICRCYDYTGYDAIIKAQELKDKLSNINYSLNNKHSIEALYGILGVTLQILEELECTNVIDVAGKISNQKVD